MRVGEWAKANTLFCDWLDRPADEVKLLLDELQTTDPNLASLVSDLFEADRDKSSLDFDLSSVVAEAGREDGPDPWIGEQLGPYRVESLLGAGGMGSVYLATHVNFRGPAAVKILSDSLSAERRARFEYEKRYLGQLSHPSIAKIFHADVHDDGTLFFAMEYVEGKPISKYCDDEGLSLRGRLALFLRVCEAVQAAHSRGIIHRDIKPSNVLVTSEGVVKLLDFGIAEIADTDSGLELNFISLPYASPEYESALPSVASDVYSLGILFHELITGRLPFSTEGKSRQQIRELVRGGDFPPPSRTCDRQRLQELSGLQWRELDWVFAKATDLEPNDRYVTSDSLSRDLRAFLEGTPLTISDAPPLYKPRKFIRRYRNAVALAAAVVTALMLIVLAYTLQLRNARNRALAAAAQAEKLTEFDRQMFDFVGYDSGPAHAMTAVGMIDRSVPLVDVIRDDPATQSELYNFLATDYVDLSAYDKADAVLRRALALDKEAFGEDSVETAKTMVSLSQLRGVQGQNQEAEQLAQRAYAIESRNLPSNDRDRLEALGALGDAYYELNKNKEAVAVEESLIKSLRGEENPKLLSIAYNTLGLAEGNMGHDDEALAANQRSMDIDRKLYGEKNPNNGSHLMTLAAIQAKHGDHAAAISNYQAAVENFSRWFGPKDPQTADAQIALGEALEGAGRAKEALPILQAALPIERSLWGDATAPVARAYNALGLSEAGTGDQRDARLYLEMALASYRKLDPEGSTRTAVVLYHLARMDLAENHFAAADSKIREAVALALKTSGPNDLYTMRSLLTSSIIFRAEHLDADARAAFASVCVNQLAPEAAAARSQACAEYAESNDSVYRRIAKTALGNAGPLKR